MIDVLDLSELTLPRPHVCNVEAEIEDLQQQMGHLPNADADASEFREWARDFLTSTADLAEKEAKDAQTTLEWLMLHRPLEKAPDDQREHLVHHLEAIKLVHQLRQREAATFRRLVELLP